MEKRGLDCDCLAATRYLDHDHPSIRERVSALIAGCLDDIQRAKVIFEFVRDQIPYNFAPDVFSWEDLKASHTLEIGSGFCVQKAVLLAAMWRAAGLPSKVGFQDIRSLRVPEQYIKLLGGGLGYHGLSVVWLAGRWVRLDASLDRALAEARGYRLIEFSWTQDQLLPPTDLAGLPHFVIDKDHGDFPDVPEEVTNFQLAEFKRLNDLGWSALVRKESASM